MPDSYLIARWSSMRRPRLIDSRMRKSAKRKAGPRAVRPVIAATRIKVEEKIHAFRRRVIVRAVFPRWIVGIRLRLCVVSQVRMGSTPGRRSSRPNLRHASPRASRRGRHDRHHGIRRDRRHDGQLRPEFVREHAQAGGRRTRGRSRSCANLAEDGSRGVGVVMFSRVVHVDSPSPVATAGASSPC